MQYIERKDGITVHIANKAEEYQQDAKKYVVNMKSSKKKLHIKDNPSCHYSHRLNEYVSFDTLEEIKELPFSVHKCDKCFPN